MEIFVGRQPILNAKKEVIAYELLYRSKDLNEFPNIDSDTATAKVLVNTLLLFGAEKVMKDKPVFVNFTENLLYSSIFDWLDPTQIVIEILEDIAVTKKLTERAREIKAKGFQIALDDFILNEQIEEYDELFQFIDYIKIDFLLSPIEERYKVEKKVKMHFPHIQLLAEKVETYDDFHIAKNSGYTLFQGYFFEKPQTLTGASIPSNTIQYLNTLVLLNDEEPNVQLVAESIENDLSLTYKLLQTINITTAQSKSKIHSVRQAIMMIGIPNLRKWIYFIAMSEQHFGDNGDFYKEIMRSSLFRAKVCELLAKRNNKKNSSEYFLTGMFSLIDTLLKSNLEDIIEKLPLSNNVIHTLLGDPTDITPYLQFSITLSKLEWDKLEEMGAPLGLDAYEMDELYSEASTWADKLL
ncbi:HDOD domain-containing protein [Metasolibacillus sp.]|uniref:EAL and HDOD domain-containing protein n=1 Tax=Metasolibacillus sp. TaxID=2703680 RepID=UPI0025F17AC6|nr:HDOD domain-containing protein [Metasolibacillus sp.]MCT6924032.1 HDOD domain-containing protein [Metasolibacillus sp.]MCT6940110.1 HDOD domain-containing protein [Metasolibacillus sp.]